MLRLRVCSCAALVDARCLLVRRVGWRNEHRGSRLGVEWNGVESTGVGRRTRPQVSGGCWTRTRPAGGGQLAAAAAAAAAASAVVEVQPCEQLMCVRTEWTIVHRCRIRDIAHARSGLIVCASGGSGSGSGGAKWSLRLLVIAVSS